MKVYQICYGLIPGDAISNHVIEVDRRLRTWGIETAMYAQHVAPQMGPRARPDHEYIAHLHEPDHVLIYHYALYSPNVRYYQATRGRRVFSYHNITPSLYFRGWDREQELLCDVGRRILPNLTECELAIGDSDYNRQELVQSGFSAESAGVMPLFLREELFEEPPADLPLPHQLRGRSGVNFLSVGRIVPNKAIEDIIRVFYTYHQGIPILTCTWSARDTYRPMTRSLTHWWRIWACRVA